MTQRRRNPAVTRIRKAALKLLSKGMHPDLVERTLRAKYTRGPHRSVLFSMREAQRLGVQCIELYRTKELADKVRELKRNKASPQTESNAARATPNTQVVKEFEDVEDIPAGMQHLLNQLAAMVDGTKFVMAGVDRSSGTVKLHVRVNVIRDIYGTVG